MRDYLAFDLTPSEESCAKVRQEGYHKNSRIEARVIQDMLLRLFPNKPESVSFCIKSNPHDFGSYLSLRIYYDDENEKSMDYAFNIENNWPNNWDKEARLALVSLGYSVIPKSSGDYHND